MLGTLRRYCGWDRHDTRNLIGEPQPSLVGAGHSGSKEELNSQCGSVRTMPSVCHRWHRFAIALLPVGAYALRLRLADRLDRQTT